MELDGAYGELAGYKHKGQKCVKMPRILQNTAQSLKDLRVPSKDTWFQYKYMFAYLRPRRVRRHT